jgi:hypothetical protein
MKGKTKIILWITFIGLVGIQLIPTELNEVKPVTSSDFLEVYRPPIEITKIFRTSCYDCHSHQTKQPWYSTIQPMNWLMQNHITEGLSELNLSDFGNLSNRMKRTKLKSMISQIEDDNMPLKSYLLIHRDAQISPSEKINIVNYLESLTE